MAINLDELLAKLQEGTVKTAEATPAPATPPAEPATPAPAAVEGNDELRKIAEEMDEAGRIIARSFYDELQKLAVGSVGLTPNPDATPDNPLVQISKADVHEQDVAKVQAIIQQLTDGERNATPDGYVQVNGQIVARTEPVVDAQTNAALPDKQPKTASADVIEKIYTRFFPEG